ncbi:enoyl-[acyl-carrier-protein] reductase, mitochondrial-like [Penaeus japonicus]|uniref:enoyl-[acyl-carrier-protein] reductase, mitochondrial-like n=1 Tax=Penaeus japonicus TaxID=27405 RepID=UPI001C7155F2|nr:enoyl-[acyl-carrier-protein] reductase, mitochondrial-like [Penaeus japonicus]
MAVFRLFHRAKFQQFEFVRQISRQFSNVSSCLEYYEYGDPLQVVRKSERTVPDLKEDEVLVKMLAATVNPADINTIQGVYAVKPPLPSVPGNEGVGRIVKVGSSVAGDFQPGDHVIPRINAWGTWRDYAVASHEELIKIPSDIDLATAATIAVNPCTAYRMLTDFVPLREGDTIIQNGGNSAVGQAVIQIAAAYGMRTINVVRNRPAIDELKEMLTKLGATVVVTEEELRKSEAVKALPKPSLALNCVSGRSGTEILRQLSPQGVMITYGGMSRKPVTVPVGSLIFSDVVLKGFWMTRWNRDHFSHPKRQLMLNELFSLAKQGRLCPPDHVMVPFQDYKTALRDAMPSDGMVGKKQILVFP